MKKPDEEFVALPNDANGLMTFYNVMFADRGIVLPAHLMPVAMALMDERIRKLLIVLGPGSGKSLLLSIAWPAFALGNDPTQTILGISAGEALVQGFMHAVMEWIEYSQLWRVMFPKVMPDKRAGWSTERGLFVTGRRHGDPDASYWGAGMDSSSLTGKHGRTILLDDIHNKENSASSTMCQKVIKTYYNTIIGRADPRGCRMVAAGRRWNADDIYAHFRDSGDWIVMHLPAERQGEQQLYYDVTVPDGLECCFTTGSYSEVAKVRVA